MRETLQKLLESAESENLDFKRKLPLKNAKQRSQLAKDICCFGNTSGGYIIVGVEDKTRKRIGIPAKSLDVKRIMKVGRERIKPPIHDIKACEVGYEGLTYGIIEIKKTQRVHQTNEGVHYVRVLDDCIPADTETIAELVRKSNEYAIEEARRLREKELSGFPEIESKATEEILDNLVGNIYSGGLLDQFNSNRNERNWIRQRIVRDGLKSFINSCSVTVDTSEDLPVHYKHFLKMRAIGMLALVTANKDEEDSSKMRIVLEYDPAVTNETEDQERFEFFTDWAVKFKDVPKEEIIKASKDADLLGGFLGNLKLLELLNEFLEVQKNAIDDGINPYTMLWAMLTTLFIDSTSDLFSGKSRWIEFVKKHIKKFI